RKTRISSTAKVSKDHARPPGSTPQDETRWTLLDRSQGDEAMNESTMETLATMLSSLIKGVDKRKQ
ncbi:MAG: hypothetical protein ACE5K9_11115, partial [Candidatus Methylomirabilales bacterium]